MMRNFRRSAAAVITAVIIFFASLPSAALSVDTKIITGEFNYYSSLVNKVLPHTYHYCDDYFSGSGKSVNEHLTTMSLDLAITAFGYYESESNTVKVLKEIGFDINDMSVRQMTGTPTVDSLGTVIAHKSTKHGNIVVAVVRGIDYGLEWQNNVTIGKSGAAEGFVNSAGTLTDRIKEYEEKFGLKGSKLWMVGYSRGGVVVDLAGKYINEHLGEFGIDDDSLYAYTFEAPAANDTADGYKNIHNVFDPNDAMTIVFPQKWGFHHAGTAEPALNEKTRLKRMKLNYIGQISVEETGKTSYMSDIEKDFVNLLASSVSRSRFADNSAYFGVIIQMLMSMSINDLQRFTDYLTGSFSSALERFSLFGIIKLLSEDEDSSGYNSDVERFCGIIGEELDSDINRTMFSDDEYPRIKEALIKTIKLLLPAVKADFSLNSPLEKICSFFCNLGEIAKHHFSDTILFPLEAKDSYYKPVPISDAVVEIDETTAEVISVTVGTRKLEPGLDYTLRYRDENGTYADPVRSGRYTAVITGSGSYTGTIEKTFNVKFRHMHKWSFTEKGDTVCVKCTEPGCDVYGTDVEYSVRISVPDKNYDGTPAQGSLEISSGFPEEITVGEIIYHDSGTHKDMSAIGKYSADVRLYVTDSPENCACASCGYSITRIKAAYSDLAIYIADDMPSETEVFYNGKKLRELKDYTVSFTDEDGKETTLPEAPGVYKVVWNGRGIYTGSVTKTFEIKEGAGAQIFGMPVIITVIICSSAVIVTITAAVIICSGRKKAKR